LRDFRLEHRKDVLCVAHGAKELLERIALLKVRRGAEDKDASAPNELRLAGAGFEICTRKHTKPTRSVRARVPAGVAVWGFRLTKVPSTSRKVRHDGRHSSRRALTARMRSCAAGPATARYDGAVVSQNQPAVGLSCGAQRTHMRG
jgi:hypothetical protein